MNTTPDNTQRVSTEHAVEEARREINKRLYISKRDRRPPTDCRLPIEVIEALLRNADEPARRTVSGNAPNIGPGLDDVTAQEGGAP